MYSNLFVKTNYSLLSSLVQIEELVTFALQNNIGSLVVCDDNLNSSMNFYKACKAKGINPVIGLDLKYADGHILMYAKNYEGYLNLAKLSTILESRSVNLEDIKTHAKNIIAVLPADSLLYFEELEAIFEDFYLGFKDKIEEQKLLNYSNNVVFINETRTLEAGDREYLKYLYMIRDGKTIADDFYYDTLDKHYFSDDEASSKSSSKGLRNSKLIADSCHVEMVKDEHLLPVFDNKLGDSNKYLKELSIKGLELRLKGNVSNEYKERLLHELSVIEKMGFPDYFLITYDYIRYAKKEGILVGPGRGSAGGSLVAYCLGITDIDPLKYNLLFERFLNIERVTMPDIDTDFPDSYRDQVIDYVTKKYGEKKVAGIITYGTLAARQVIRDCGKVLNASTRLVEKLCQIVPSSNSNKLSFYYANDKNFKDVIDSDEKMGLLYKLAQKFEGYPRHTSIHAAGIVMSRKDLDEVLPLVKSNEMYLTAYTLNYLEDIGLLKMDFLGIKNLTTIMNIIEEINKEEKLKLNFNDIPLESSEVLDLFSRGDTLGVFQFETDGMRKFLKSLKPSSFEEVVDAIALFRPGPNENIPSYIARKEGREKVEYLDPSLESILKTTKGIIIYQEQIMQIAHDFAGFTMAEADILRVAMSKKKKDILASYSKKFISGAVALGHDQSLAEKLYELIQKFAGYGFNKSHSVAYSIIAFRMAYLKTHYPKYFFSNLLSSTLSNSKKTSEYIAEAKRLGIEVLPPDIQLSGSTYLVEDAGIRFPISAISGIGAITARNISIKEKYKDIYEAFSHLASSGVNKKMFEDMIYVSCFKSFGFNNQTLITNLDKMLNYANLVKDLDESLITKPEIDQKEEYSKEFLMTKEKEIFGFYLSSHPSVQYKEKYRAIDLIDIEKFFDKVVDSVILVESIKEIKTKKGDAMSFVLGSDETSSADYTLFPEKHSRFAIKQGDLLLVKGKVEKRLDKYQIIVQNIKKLND